MIIAATALAEYLCPEMDVKVCHPDGTAWKTLPAAAIEVLADRRMVTGRGSRTKLKAVYLSADTHADLAEDVIERAIRASFIRGRLAQSQASQTCILSKWLDRRGIPTAVYMHVRTWFFSPQQRQQYA